MRQRLLAVRRGRVAWADEAARDYGRRLRRYAPFEEVVIRPASGRAGEAAVRAEEARRILRHLGAGDRVIALDERGEDLDTPGFARLLDAARQEGVGALTWVLGGPLGLDEAVRHRADRVVRLSSLVLNHQVARIVLLEQVYRAWTLLLGEPYHH